jgi:hypothetical protein
MAEDRPQQVSIGFQGGQVLAVRVLPKELTGLRKSLEADTSRWHELRDAEGTSLVDLGQVVYVRADSDEHKIGF